MEFDITQQTLKQVLSSTGPLVDEIVVDFNEEGIHTAGVDPSNVAMVDIELDESAFEKYSGDDKQRGLDLERFGDRIGMASSGDAIHVEETDEGGKLRIEFGGLSFTMGLVSVDAIRGADQDKPNLDWDAEFSIPAADLQRGKDACNMVSDHFTLNIDDETFEMLAEGDTDDVNFDVEPLPDDAEDSEDGLRFDSSPDDCEAKYSLKYLDDIIDAVPNGTEVDISFGDNLPILLGFDIAGGAGRVEYVIAPRVDM